MFPGGESFAPLEDHSILPLPPGGQGVDPLETCPLEEKASPHDKGRFSESLCLNQHDHGSGAMRMETLESMTKKNISAFRARHQRQ